jgi:hypothetical protein
MFEHGTAAGGQTEVAMKLKGIVGAMGIVAFTIMFAGGMLLFRILDERQEV